MNMSEKQEKHKKRKKRKLRDKIDPYDLLYDIELDLYLECMELDRKRKRRHYIV